MTPHNPSKCDMQNDELLCSCYNTNFAYIFHFHFTTKWEVDVKHTIELFYSLDYIDDYPITFNDQYMVIQYRSSHVKESSDHSEHDESPHEDPNILIYKLDQADDEEDTNLYFAIYQSEIKEDNFNIVDFELNYENGQAYLYLLLKQSRKGHGTKKKTLVMKKFSLSEYSLEYDLSSYRYRDVATFIASDLLNNKIEFTLHMMLKVNLVIYLFLFMTIAFGLILLVMLSVYIVKKKQIRKLKNIISERKKNDFQNKTKNTDLGNELMRGLEEQIKRGKETIEKGEVGLDNSEIVESKKETDKDQNESDEVLEKKGNDEKKQDSGVQSVDDSLDDRVIG